MIDRLRLVAWPVCLLLAASAAAPATVLAQDKPRERTITIQASGEVQAEPDQAVISTGVVTEGDTARAALAANSTAMRKVIDGLKAAGLASRDIRTSQFSVEPRYTSAKVAIQGFRVTNRVQLVVRDIARLGEVLDLVSGLGANQMGGISFVVTKAETLADEARGRAMENAFRRAQLYAKAAGAEVGPVQTISENVVYPRPYAAPMARAASAPVPIEQGEQTLTVNVNVTWALK